MQDTIHERAVDAVLEEELKLWRQVLDYHGPSRDTSPTIKRTGSHIAGIE